LTEFNTQVTQYSKVAVNFCATPPQSGKMCGFYNTYV
jgi:hypothetical protein